MSNSNPDRVCNNRPDHVRIKVHPLPEDPQAVLIEADAEGFKFLSDIFAAQAIAEDCGFEISPSGAGQAIFASGSTLGFYLHRTPCENHRKLTAES
jgi:hypothetical protein